MTLDHRAILLLITLFVLGPSSLSAQDVSALPASATPPEVYIPEYDVQATSRVKEDRVTELDRFAYEVELSWEGSQQWFSLESPEVEWPDGIVQIEASQKSGSSMGDSGPVGTKSFLYLLEAQRAGEVRFPTIRVELLAPGTEEPITVEAPGTNLTVLERKPSASEKFSTFLSDYWYLVVGVAGLLCVALVLFVVKSRKDRRIAEAPSDPWAPIDEILKKSESLRGGGRDREYYETLEKGVRAGLALVGASPNQAGPGKIEGLPQSFAEDLQALLSECSERKYRPDRPRPEEMDRSLRQAKSVIKALKEYHQKRGTAA